MSPASSWLHRLLENAALRPDVGRGLRASVAFGVPLFIGHAVGAPADAVFVSVAAQIIAIQDLRGAYRVRLAILATMALVVSGAALLGVATGGHLVSATLAMGLIALLGSAWRHLSADYGPGLSVASALLFLLGLAQPGGLAEGLHLAALIALGGVGAAVLHVGFWLFRPQHPLRYAVAESWVALSDLLEGMRPKVALEKNARSEAIAAAERELRAALDRTFLILGAAEGRQSTALIRALEELRREVVHLAMRSTAFNTSLEPRLERPNFARHLPAVDSLLKALSDAARSVAITLITHRAENFAAAEVRLQRCRHLLQVVDDQLQAAPSEVSVAQARAALAQLKMMPPRIRAVLEKTIDQNALRVSFPARLPDLTARSIQSLSGWINSAPHLDPVLVRYSVRMALLTMLAVALYKGFGIPRGYWIAFTIVVVLQPDYGSTRRRAGERIGGTLMGSLLGSGLLWIKMPLFWLDGCASALSFGFAYCVRRRYGVAVFFVTLQLVLITEITTSLHLDFTVVRLLCNLFGGAVALVSALFFWPTWEREKFPTVLAAAVRANRAYLEAIFQPDGAPLMAKRRAENAHRSAAASLQRLLGEPGRAPENARAAALATYNQRVTRNWTALVVHLPPPSATLAAPLAPIAQPTGLLLEKLAQIFETNDLDTPQPELLQDIRALENLIARAHPDAGGMAKTWSNQDLLWTHFTKGVAEIRAMILALELPAHPAS